MATIFTKTSAFLLLAALVHRTNAIKTCHAISKSVTDAWCQANCNHVPVNCPANLCKCSAAPAPSPKPPTPPSPSPKPPTPPGPSPGPTPGGGGFPGPIFELDLFVNDPAKGWQPTGWPEYLQHSAANYTNVAGISFIQPKDLMNDSYDLPAEVASAVRSLRTQGVAVQLLVGGEVANGWNELEANPGQAANKALDLMHKYDCGIEVDCEAGGDGAGIVKFIEICAKGKPNGTYISMDVGGTPNGEQKTVIQGAMDSLDWVNMMVSAPAYDQGNSVHFGHLDGIPFNKMTIAYYAGTWVDNCNSVGSPGDNGDTAAGIALFHKNGLKGLSIWAVGGASYSNCKTNDAAGFSQAMTQLGAHN